MSESDTQMSDKERSETLLNARALALNGKYADSVDYYAKLIAEPNAIMDRELFREALSVQQRGQDRELDLGMARVRCGVANIVGRNELERLLANETYGDPKRLERCGWKVCSQNEEDGMLAEVFRRIGTTNKKFIEIGIEGGLECNTHYLLHRGWTGVWIEGNEPMYAQAITHFHYACLAGQLTIVNGWATRETINEQVSGLSTPDEIDLLSIDIDGMDYWVWKELTATSPRVVIIEYNSTFAPPMLHVVPYNADWLWDGSHRFGASLQSLTDMAAAKGYQLVGCNITGGNAIFVRSDLVGDAFATPATATYLYQPPRFYLFRLGAFDSGHPYGAGAWLDI